MFNTLIRWRLAVVIHGMKQSRNRDGIGSSTRATLSPTRRIDYTSGTPEGEYDPAQATQRRRSAHQLLVITLVQSTMVALGEVESHKSAVMNLALAQDTINVLPCSIKDRGNLSDDEQKLIDDCS